MGGFECLQACAGVDREGTLGWGLLFEAGCVSMDMWEGGVRVGDRKNGFEFLGWRVPEDWVGGLCLGGRMNGWMDVCVWGDERWCVPWSDSSGLCGLWRYIHRCIVRMIYSDFILFFALTTTQ